MTPFKLVSFEGIDGAGKTTCLDKLAAINDAVWPSCFLAKRQLEALAPEDLREQMALLKQQIWPERQDPPGTKRTLSDLFLMYGWFCIICEVIEPLLDQKHIFVDGWYFKSLCRFSTRSASERALAERIYATIRKPDIVIYFDVTPEVAAVRKQAFSPSECGLLDGYSGPEQSAFIKYQTQQRALYSALAETENWHLIDVCSLDADATAQKVITYLSDHLP